MSEMIVRDGSKVTVRGPLALVAFPVFAALWMLALLLYFAAIVVGVTLYGVSSLGLAACNLGKGKP